MHNIFFWTGDNAQYWNTEILDLSKGTIKFVTNKKNLYLRESPAAKVRKKS